MRKGIRCYWLTGMPCSGKTTLASALEKEMFKRMIREPIILDGDAVRDTPLANTMGYDEEARRQHLLRMGYIAKMFVNRAINVICAFVSPSNGVRREIREMFDKEKFIEIWVNAPKDICQDRDVKGMYAAAKRGEIKGFTGVDAVYEKPDMADITVNTHENTVEECIKQILGRIERYG